MNNPLEKVKQSEKKLSERELEKLKERANKCLVLVRSHPEASISYRHLTGNMASKINWFLVILKRKGKDYYLKDTTEEQQKFCENLTTSMDAIEKYFRLLEQYPKFAEKELAYHNDGQEDYRKSATRIYFPEIFRKGMDSEKVVDSYEKALKEEKT